MYEFARDSILISLYFLLYQCEDLSWWFDLYTQYFGVCITGYIQVYCNATEDYLLTCFKRLIIQFKYIVQCTCWGNSWFHGILPLSVSMIYSLHFLTHSLHVLANPGLLTSWTDLLTSLFCITHFLYWFPNFLNWHIHFLVPNLDLYWFTHFPFWITHFLYQFTHFLYWLTPLPNPHFLLPHLLYRFLHFL